MQKLDKNLFWDIDFNQLDYQKHADFIIKRILEYGDKEMINWMFNHFTTSQIKKTLLTKRGISIKSANYWSLILNISKNKILCLKKQSQKKLRKTWNY